MTSQNWLVTGGAGFIGANFVRWVLEHRPEVRVVVIDKKKAFPVDHVSSFFLMVSPTAGARRTQVTCW